MKLDPTLVQPSNAVRAEAAAWVARLHSTGRTNALEAALRRWLNADPAHTRAFEIATEAWEIGGSVRLGAMPHIADAFINLPRRRVYFARRPLGAAAAVLLALVGGLFYWLGREPAIATAVGEQRMLTLTDGTRIFLNTDTRLFVEESATQRRVILDSGEALFDVAQDPKRPFVVAAGDKEVLALGTSFVIRRDAQQVVVTLVEGKVAVSSLPPSPLVGKGRGEGSSSLTLTPGQRLTLVRRNPPRLDAPVLDEVTAWRRGEVVLDKTRLQDAVEEMNRYSAVELQIDGDEAAEILVSGIFRAGDSARFARAVGEAYHLSIQHEPQRIVISGAHD